MFSKLDFWARDARIGRRASAGLLALVLLTACGTRHALPDSPQEAAPKTAMPVTAGAGKSESAVQTVASPAMPPASAPASSPSAEAVVRLLSYADRLRSMPTADLNQEIARLGNPMASPEQLQLALALGQLHQTPELIRAQELLTRILNNPTAEAQILHPLARLLAARYGEQRRLEDQLEKQIQQVREVQRRLDQTHERLEALKAIERSLTSRPPAGLAPSPMNRTRPPAP